MKLKIKLSPEMLSQRAASFCRNAMWQDESVLLWMPPFAVRRYPQLPAQRWKNKRLRENSSLANYFVIPLSGISGNLFVLTKLLGAVKQQSILRWFKSRTNFCSGRGLSQSTQILSENAGITDGSLPLRCFSSQLLFDVPPWLECSPKFFFLIRHPPKH